MGKKAAAIDFKLSELKHELMANGDLLDQSQVNFETVEEARASINSILGQLKVDIEAKGEIV